jgi:squalene-associated FAD-dependent desaturase
MYAIYAFCREIDDIADEPGAEATKLAALAAWRGEIERLFAGAPTRPTSRSLLGPLRTYDLPKEEFLALIDGMEMDAREAMVAPSRDQLELYCRRVAGAVGMLSIKAFGARDPAAPELALVLGEAFQLINILRDLAEDAARGRLYLPREMLERHGIATEDPRSALADPAVAQVCAELGALARRRLTRGQELLAQCRWRSTAACYGDWKTAAGTNPKYRSGYRPWKRLGSRCATDCSDAMAKVHVVGAGIAGLACAVALVRRGVQVTLYEAAAQAGGRCRSYYDAKLDCQIDNGNHILLSANHAALSYLEEIGAGGTLMGPPRASFPFLDLETGEAWTLKPNAGPLPWWLLDPARRIPGTRLASYLAGLKLAFAGAEDTVEQRLDPNDPLWRRFWEPLTVAALNTGPEEASARLLWLVLRETFARGEAACRPLIARDSLDRSFVAPALDLLRGGGAQVVFNHRLRALDLSGDRVKGAELGDQNVPLDEDDWLVLAVPPVTAGMLVPGLDAPEDAWPIVNAHLRLPVAPKLPDNLPFLGLVGGTAHWLFARGEVASLTVSAARTLAEEPTEEIERRLWNDTAQALGLDPAQRPPMRVIKERRATFAQTPGALAKRAPARTAWRNLLLAGDWTDTGYPATIESAVRSGRAAAQIIKAS